MTDDPLRAANSDAPTPSYLQDLRGYVDHWARVGPILAEVERQELLAMDVTSRQRAIHNLLQLGYAYREKRMTSGLVEYQRLTAKLHR